MQSFSHQISEDELNADPMALQQYQSQQDQVQLQIRQLQFQQ
jgi:hypothetical protein